MNPRTVNTRKSKGITGDKNGLYVFGTFLKGSVSKLLLIVYSRHNVVLEQFGGPIILV
jgi:hypothetical protein